MVEEAALEKSLRCLDKEETLELLCKRTKWTKDQGVRLVLGSPNWSKTETIMAKRKNETCVAEGEEA